jgi:hypothetical protein
MEALRRQAEGQQAVARIGEFVRQHTG